MGAATGSLEFLPGITYMALYLVSCHVLHSNNTKTSTHWKLNADTNKVTGYNVNDGDPIPESREPVDNNNDVLYILLNKNHLTPGVDGVWEVRDSNLDPDRTEEHFVAEFPFDADLISSQECFKTIEKSQFCTNNLFSAANADPSVGADVGMASSFMGQKAGATVSIKGGTGASKKSSKRGELHRLTCGSVPNGTEWDSLEGIAKRKEHPNSPEPEVAIIFRQPDSQSTEVDIEELAERLYRAKLENPGSSFIYNQLGNFWRIQGEVGRAIDCFRRALHVHHDHPEALLNLARVLFNLNFLDDALLLAKRSLSAASSNAESSAEESSPWLQHFTLGEILRASGVFREAAVHFRHTLDLNPAFTPAEAHLREIQAAAEGTVTYYTLFIIMFLVMGVLCGVLTSIETSLEEEDGSGGGVDANSNGSSTSSNSIAKGQRHFNRAMAMRSIRLGIQPRLMKMRRSN